MNNTEPRGIFSKTNAPEDWQDKLLSARVRAASIQPLPADLPARNTNEPENYPAKKPHSTKRRTKLAAGWIDYDTDAIIEQRLREGRRVNKYLTRSKVIAAMLKEAAQSDAFKRNQAVLAPIIQEAIRAEFRLFTNRFLAVIARIAYQVGMIVPFIYGAFANYLAPDTLHKLETECEKSAREGVTKRSPQVTEVVERLKQAMEEKA